MKAVKHHSKLRCITFSKHHYIAFHAISIKIKLKYYLLDAVRAMLKATVCRKSNNVYSPILKQPNALFQNNNRTWCTLAQQLGYSLWLLTCIWIVESNLQFAGHSTYYVATSQRFSWKLNLKLFTRAAVYNLQIGLCILYNKSTLCCDEYAVEHEENDHVHQIITLLNIKLCLAVLCRKVSLCDSE
jgi:hypothetical protein